MNHGSDLAAAGLDPTRPPSPDRQLLFDSAADVLRANDLGSMIAAAPRLYPHQWSWDAAIIAVGLAQSSVERALAEFRTLLAAQWSTGMIPHIVFGPDDGYFPGPDVWGTDGVPAKPDGVRTSGICQPPIHAHALRRIREIAVARGAAGPVDDYLRHAVPQLERWHTWLSTARRGVSDGGVDTGLVAIHHGWESGMDNSPRWDDPYGRIVVDRPIALQRRDTGVVADASQRPTDEEYQRYLHLVRQMREVGYDDEAVRETVDFRVGDVLMTAVLAMSARDLAALAEAVGAPGIAAEQGDLADRATRAVAATVDPRTGLCRDVDLRTGEPIEVESPASFALLLSGGDAADVQRQREIITGPRWAGHPSLAFPVPPTQSPDAPGFRPRTYWRGPVWPVLTWLFVAGLEADGERGVADEWRTATLAQLADLQFGEYYEPRTGEALGSHQQSWTAAVAVDWSRSGT